MTTHNPIKPLLIGVIETALNSYLRLDDNIEQLLTPMAGKVIAVHISGWDTTLYVCPNQDNIQILEQFNGEADASLTGSLTALGLMGMSATPMRAFFKGEVRLDGDMQLARKLQRLFEKLDINLEAKLARYTGSHFARQVAGFVGGSRHWASASLTTLRLNLEEFLQEETRQLPAKPEAELLFQDIDACQSDYDRLNARIQRISATLEQTHAHQPQTGSSL
ncbi:SCP2 sterol-binding domain-containing protein [Methylomonas paludis]|uniref:Ubiquinone biosynthesis accessory factor UbiJ n=1 Tax=Methylomonas paludis TaxID=1173101 RepID=A0A975R8Y4_9GAMM|nr:SCP2 sterol-binding domain-containing protein [Methylomonas paludis]QWF69606.1 SCP2 sterol-binding domain-containing protein [Methylomonas paludis]